MLRGVVVCCSVAAAFPLAVDCKGVLQCVAVAGCCSVLQRFLELLTGERCVALCCICRVLHCVGVAVCCSV